ncbi:MAG: efflux RND transporter periplasmic adaptor subunit [Clostridia bacterium]|nr:efflux RND transporter periplasmic adaptor subunit [Clostridia bacterium]
MKKNKKFYFSLVAVLIVMIVAGGIFLKTAQGKANADMVSNVGQGISIPVSTVAVEEGTLADTVFAVGAIQPSASYDVNAKISGEVAEIFFNVGDTVKEGDVLFKMKDNTFNSDKASKAQGLKNQMDLAKIQYDQATKTYNDSKILFESGAVSSDQLDQANLAYKNAKANYENASLSYNAGVSGLSDQSDYYTVKSPVDGLITDRNIEAGMFASTQNGFTIIVDDSLKINATIASKYIGQVAIGQPVNIYVNTLNQYYTGEISSISYAAKKGSYPIEVLLKNSDKSIYSGMFAELNIEVAHKENILLIPIESLIKEGQTEYVYKIVDGIAVKTPVTTGIRSNSQIEASGDLAKEDLITLEGKEFLKDGAQVMVK